MPTSQKSTSNTRYHIQVNNKGQKFVQCKDSPNISFFIEKGFVTNKDNLYKFTEPTIFIDGAFDGPPFLDNEKKIYSFDHHQGVVRSFTLASCEQVLLMILKGFDLRTGHWSVYGNEPDSDMIISMWLLANQRLIEKNRRNLRYELVRLTRVAGLIDSHGFSVFSFLGYSEHAIIDEVNRLNHLLEVEKKHKSEGTWNNFDYTEYTLEMFEKLDSVILHEYHFEIPYSADIIELQTIEVEESKLLKFVYSNDSIYDVEQELKHTYGTRLAIIILQKAPKQYTIKLVDEFYTRNLNGFYQSLNAIDKAVDFHRSNTWGGSDIIGGSPRLTGTQLNISEIIKVAKNYFSSSL